VRIIITLHSGVRIRVRDIRALPDNALHGKLQELNLELGIERRKIASTGVASKVVKTREIKRTIARIKTILKERGAKK
jgi:ribosomal protein L29